MILMLAIYFVTILFGTTKLNYKLRQVYALGKTVFAY